MSRWLVGAFWILMGISLYLYLRAFWTTVHDEIDKNNISVTTPEMFVPTNEWQLIKENHILPKGLHIRMNLQTGKKEAKLLSSEKHDSSEQTSLTVASDAEAPDGPYAEKLKYEYIEEALKKIPDEGKMNEIEDELETVRKKFRSYDELKKQMSDIKMSIKTDAELLDELIKKYNTLYVGKSLNEQKLNELVSILKDLEYLLHQVDNAREFARRNGISDIIVPCLKTNSTEIRKLAARVLGSAVQNNGKVQIAALEAGVVTLLIQNIALEKDYELRSSSIYALSCLVRSFPLAELALIDEGGLSVLMSIFKDDSAESLKLQLKIVAFFNDLVIEKEDAQLTMHEKEVTTANITENIPLEELKQISEKVRQYKIVGFSTKLVEVGWCPAIHKLLAKNSLRKNSTPIHDISPENLKEEDVNHEVVDVVSSAVHSMVSPCKHEFQDPKLFSTLTTLLRYYAKLSIDETDDKFYTGIHQTLNEICEDLKIK